MSLLNYSESKDNKFNFTNDEIKLLYDNYRSRMLGETRGYIMHIAKTTEEALDSEFLMNSIVRCANKEYVCLYKSSSLYFVQEEN